MKKMIPILCLLLALVVLGACSGKTAGEKNAKGLLHALYDCPDEVMLQSPTEDGVRQMEEKYRPYLAEKYQENFVSKYALSLHGMCGETGATTKITELRTVPRDDRVEAELVLACTDGSGKMTDVTLRVNLSTDEEGKITFYQQMTDSRELYTAIGMTLGE